jgi:6-pyruvoyltetrahydropterin/6-carboxytetrahydropterin synthase
MAYRICKTVEIDNAHMLSKHPGNCRFVHGHTRRIEVVVESNRLNHNDMVCDFADLKAVMLRHVEAWDHALCMNDADPNYSTMRDLYAERLITFEKRDPTTEVLAETLFKALWSELKTLGDGVRLRRIRVWETPTSWAEYEQ